MLLVSDEVICAFGRLGTMFACDKFGYVPDMITCAKGMTSGYSPIGACIVSDRLAEPFYKGDNTFLHGYTFGGHPVSAAVGLANLDIFERENLNQHVLDNEGAFRATLEKLHDLPIVGDVRGNGYFYGIELVKDKATKQSFNEEETERVLYGFLSRRCSTTACTAARTTAATRSSSWRRRWSPTSRRSTRSSRSCAPPSRRRGRSSEPPPAGGPAALGGPRPRRVGGPPDRTPPHRPARQPSADSGARGRTRTGASGRGRFLLPQHRVGARRAACYVPTGSGD